MDEQNIEKDSYDLLVQMIIVYRVLELKYDELHESEEVLRQLQNDVDKLKQGNQEILLKIEEKKDSLLSPKKTTLEIPEKKKTKTFEIAPIRPFGKKRSYHYFFMNLNPETKESTIRHHFIQFSRTVIVRICKNSDGRNLLCGFLRMDPEGMEAPENFFSQIQTIDGSDIFLLSRPKKGTLVVVAGSLDNIQEETLRKHFSSFGIIDTVMKSTHIIHKVRLAYLQCRDPLTADTILRSQNHVINGKILKVYPVI